MVEPSSITFFSTDDKCQLAIYDFGGSGHSVLFLSALGFPIVAYRLLVRSVSCYHEFKTKKTNSHNAETIYLFFGVSGGRSDQDHGSIAGH